MSLVHSHAASAPLRNSAGYRWSAVLAFVLIAACEPGQITDVSARFEPGRTPAENPITSTRDAGVPRSSDSGSTLGTPDGGNALGTPDVLANDSESAEAIRSDGGPSPPDGARDGAVPDGGPGPVAAVSPLPVIWIETGGKPIVEGTKIAGRIKVIQDHDGTHNDIEEAPVAFDSAMGIEIRGNFTATFPKLSYSVELRDETGIDVERPLLGMPPGSDWVLYACYLDKTCFRNALAYELGQNLGRWNPRYRFVEVYIDGKYEGLYNVVERIRRDKWRVNIPKPAPDAKAGDVSGGYIFRHEGAGAGQDRDWRSKQGVVWTYHYPRYDEITAAQKKYLQDHVDRFESMMKGNDWNHPNAGYRSWIDVESWVDHVLVQELSKNWDGYVRSVYFYKTPQSQGGLLFASPLWDFDMAFGNVTPGASHDVEGFAHDRRGRVGFEAVPFFFLKLWSDDDFQRAVRCRWQTLRATFASTEAMLAKVDEWTRMTADAQKRDQARWMTIGKRITPAAFTGKTWAEDAEYFRDWLTKRAAWLDESLPGTCR